MFPPHPPCFVHLGKHGDLMIMMPGWRQMFLETRVKPVVLCSHQFSETLDGISYIEPWVETLEWYGDITRAKHMALKKYGWCIIPKWWDDPEHIIVRRPWDELVNLDSHGRQIAVPAFQWDSYMLAQWRAAGFKDSEMGRWPLVFDRRSPEREQALVSRFRWHKPVILFNLSGNSSKFPFSPEVQRVLYAHRDQFSIVDVSEIHCHRIYDLLGLFERAAMLVTADTSTLHLASACKIPLVAFIADGGGGSIVNGNAVMKCRYSAVPHRLGELQKVLASLAGWGNVAHTESITL